MLPTGKRPIDHPFGNQFAVGHDDFRTAGGANDAGADTDSFDDANGIIDLNDITDTNRTLEQQNQA